MTEYAQQPTDGGDGAVAAGGTGAPEARAPGRAAGAALPVFDAVVLAGGAAKRLGGTDKPSVSVGGRSLLNRVLAACAGAATTVVVGGRRPTARPVVWAREEPPGGGPLAALHAGLRRTTAERVVVLSADLPFLDATAVRRLLTALDDENVDCPRGPGDNESPRRRGSSTSPGGREGDDSPRGREDNDSPGRPEGSIGPRRRGGDDVPGGPGDTDRTDLPHADPDASPAPSSPPAPSRPATSRPAASRATAPAASATPATPTVPQSRAAAAPPAAPLAGAGPEGAVLLDRAGRDQPLVGAYRSEPLRREIALLAAEHGGLSGLPLRLLTTELTLSRISDPVASFDCDTWDAIAAARSRIREHEHVLDEWISAVKDELGLDPDFDVDTSGLLDLTRDVAHGVARPAGPLTTFLVGYAAARQGGGPEAVAEAMRKATALAARWADEDGADAKPDAG